MTLGIARLLTQQVTVETYEGSGAYGDAFAAPVTVNVFIDDGRRLIRDSEGNQVVSETTLFCALADLDAFPEGSRVTVNDRAARVLLTKRRDAAGPVNIHHGEIHLT